MAVAAIHTGALLDEIEEVFALSNSAMGRLFGVSRQAIGQWRARGVPGSRQEKVATVAAVADLLLHSLKPERIAGAARRPAAAYGGVTMLEMIRRDRHRALPAGRRRRLGGRPARRALSMCRSDGPAGRRGAGLVPARAPPPPGPSRAALRRLVLGVRAWSKSASAVRTIRSCSERCAAG